MVGKAAQSTTGSQYLSST